MKSQYKQKIEAVDLFCGVGGLTRGLLDAGITVSAGFDIDVGCKYAYEANNKGAKFFLKDISDLTSVEVARCFSEKSFKVLAGCAPCQPFSKYTQGQNNKDDAKWSLLGEFLRIVRDIQPDIVSMENVPEMQRHAIFKQFYLGLIAMGYNVDFKVIDCTGCGVPQHRKRLVLLASRLGVIGFSELLSIEFLKTVKDTIAHLPSIEAGGEGEDRLHRSCKLSSLNLKRIRSSRPGGSWRDWPVDLVASCHKTERGKYYSSVYGRMSWDEPAPTITTQFFGYGNGRFGHPVQDRAISLREGALLQSFPFDYKFLPDDEPISFATVGRMIGNAVPVKLGEFIGRSIVEHIDGL